MASGKKRILVLVTSILLVYALYAIIETVNLNSKTVDEAFIKFTESQSLKTKIVDKTVYTVDNIAFVPFKTGNQVSMVIFEKGWFGWEIKEYSRKLQSDGFDYSSDMNLYYGIIPENLVAKTQVVKINGKDAKTIKLNEITKFWIKIYKKNHNQQDDNDNNVTIHFLNAEGNLIGKL